MAQGTLEKLWQREVTARLLDHGMRGVEPIRAEVLSGVSGRVLEIGCGTGVSLAHYRPSVTELVLVEPAAELAAIARARMTAWAEGKDTRVSLLEQSATRPLPLEDASFDAVVVLFVLCSIERLDAALEEAHRLLRPGGALHLAEHVAAEGDPTPHRARARAQRLIRPMWQLALGGCNPHKELEAVLDRNGFEVADLRRRELELPWVVRSGLVGRAPRR